MTPPRLHAPPSPFAGPPTVPSDPPAPDPLPQTGEGVGAAAPPSAPLPSSGSEVVQGEPLLPTFLRVAGRKVVLVGGGTVAAAKHATLLAAGAEITVVAPSIRPELRRPGTTILERAFLPQDLDGAWFAVAAATPEVNRAVLEAALPRRLFVNAADDPPAATAFAGSVARRGPITIAVSTAGTAPALAALIREGLESLLPAELDRWTAAARDARMHWRQSSTPMPARRPQLLAALNDLYSTPPTSASGAPASASGAPASASGAPASAATSSAAPPSAGGAPSNGTVDPGTLAPLRGEGQGEGTP
jgi:uroporphyrin-III C-methyltransferase / precorrin-2 dehydrogenase / sirohydrochlorin ferrochelatase